MINSIGKCFGIMVSSCWLVIAANAQAPVQLQGNQLVITRAQHAYTFSPSFVVLYNAVDPGMALKPAGIKKVEYNVLTWKVSDSAKADFKQKKVNASMAGDGFDDRILRTKADWR